jgi:hypothetical protein
MKIAHLARRMNRLASRNLALSLDLLKASHHFGSQWNGRLCGADNYPPVRGYFCC